MYYDWIQSNKKAIVTTAITFAVVIIGWSAFTYVSRIGKVGVTISAVPSDSRVLIDGNKGSSGTRWLLPGSYVISAEKEGFKTREKTVIVSAEKEKNVVALSLTPESDTAKRWMEANDTAYKANEQYGSIEARANGDYLRIKYPITTVLPYTDPYYSISYSAQPDTTIVITISTVSPRYRYLAVQKFRELDYNPTDFKIQFEDFKNPLGDHHE